jgi:hypothetical protein
MEQGYQIAVANSVAMVGFTAKDNVLMTNTLEAVSQTFRNVQHLSKATTEIVLERVEDPNVLPFIHVTLVFMFFITRHSAAINLPEAEFP